MNTFVGNESSLTVGGLSGGLSQPGDEEICVNFILAGDLGGTNTRLALYKAEGRGRDTSTNDASPNAFHHPVVMEEFLNEEYFVVGAEETLLNECGVEVKAVYRSTNHLFVLKLLRPFLKRYFWDQSSPSPWQQQRQHYLRTQDKHTPSDDLVINIVMCFGVAGPIDPDTNRGTVLTSQRPSYLTGLSGKGIWEECTCCELSHYHDRRSRLYVKVDSCSIINDFVAQGYGCLSLDRTAHEEVIVLNYGRRSGGNNETTTPGPLLCVGAGTGFGSCYLTPSATTTTTTTTSKATNPLNRRTTKLTYTCFPSEVGQIEWVPTTSVTVPLPPVLLSTSSTSNRAPNEEDDTNGLGVLDLWKYLVQQNEEKRVAVEDVVSGVGVTKLYDYYYTSMIPNENLSNLAHSQVIHTEYSTTTKPTLQGKIVGDNYHHCPICKYVMDTVLLYVTISKSFMSLIMVCSSLL